MELMPKVCTECGGPMSTPIPGRRTGLLLSTCRDCRLTIHSATSLVADAFKPAVDANHGGMFLPSTARPEPPKPRAGAMDRFDRALVGGTLRKVITQQRKQAAEAAEIDPKLQQLPEHDR